MLVADAGTTSYDGGRVLLGGSPRRVLRLTDRGAARVRALLDGAEPADETDTALARRLLDAGLAHPQLPSAPRIDGVDLVIPAYGSRPLTSLPNTTVVDDGSPDRIAGAAVTLPVNRGPAAARNAGLAATSAPIVAFVDSDVDVSADVVGRLAAMLDDPAIAAVAPRIYPIGSRLDMGSWAGVVRPGARTSYVPSTVLVVRRSAVEAVGGFDETLRVGEDVDLVWRLVASGWTVRYVPDLAAMHREPASVVARLDRSRRYGTSAGPLAHRHPDAPLSPPIAPVAALLLAMAGRRRLAATVLAASALGPARRLHAAGVPARDAVGIASTTTIGSTTYASRWLWQLWAPLLFAFAANRASRVALAAAVLHPRALDDLAYGAGVWSGCVRTRSFRPVAPRVGRLNM